MKKRLLSWIMVVCMLLTLAPSSVLAAVETQVASVSSTSVPSTEPPTETVTPTETATPTETVTPTEAATPTEVLPSTDSMIPEVTLSEAATAVRAQIAALPTADQWNAMSLEEQNEAGYAAYAASDAYDALSEEDKAALDEDYQVLTGLFGVMNGMVSEYEEELQDYVYVGGPNASLENKGTSADAPTLDMWTALSHLKPDGKIVVCGVSTAPLYHFGAEGGGGIILRDLFFTNTDGVNTYDDAKLILNDYVYMEANITFEHMEIEAIRKNYGGYCLMLSNHPLTGETQLVVEINLNDIKMAKHTYMRTDGIEVTEDTYLMIGNMNSKSATVNVTDCDFGMNAVDSANNLTLNLTRASVVSTPSSSQLIGDVSLNEGSTLVTRQVLRSVTADRSQNMLKGYNETAMTILGEVTIDGTPIKLAPSDRIQLGADLTLVQSAEENASLTADKFTVDAPYTLVKRENQITTDHTYADTWTADADGHWHAATCGHPEAKGDYAEHSGGTATCHTQAVCEVCQTAYGEFDKTNHDGPTEVRGATEPDYYKEGYTGDTYCLVCGEMITPGTPIPKLIDSEAPEVIGITDGGTYMSGVTFTVTDVNLKAVTVDGTALTPVNGLYKLTVKTTIQTVRAVDQFDNETVMKVTIKITPHWVQDKNGWKYQNADSSFVKNDWKLIYGKKYYFGSNGYMQIGWKKIDGKWYYLSKSANDGSMKTGWQKISGKWYYLGSSNDGAMKIGWQTIYGKRYYLSSSMSDGSMKTGWQKISGKWYYLGKSANDGSMKTGWQNVSGKWYYMYSPSGQMASNTWVGRYYVNSSGAWVSTR